MNIRKFLIAVTAFVFVTSAALTQTTNPAYTLTAAKIATALGYTPANPANGVTPAGGFTISPRSFPNTGPTPTASAPSITTTYITQIYIPANATLTGISIRNNSATGNATVGLADSTGAPIATAKSASTALTVAGNYQDIPFAAPYAAVGPATYYVQAQFSSAGSSVFFYTIGAMGTMTQTAQTYGTLTSFTPPTTFTTVSGAAANVY